MEEPEADHWSGLLMAQKKGRPDGWSEQLWRTYCAYGEADQKHIASCNRFLNAMLHLYPEQLIELIQELTESGTEDELDLYRAWYKRHIKWPKECVCEIQGSFTDPHGDPLMDFDQENLRHPLKCALGF